MTEKIIWNQGITKTVFPQLCGDIDADIVIVGAGITGLTAAYVLSNGGKYNVAVVEANYISESATAKSSAHLTTASDYSYESLRSKYNIDTCKAVADSRQFAISFIQNLATDINCDFKTVSGYLYTENPNEIDRLQTEKEVALQAGLDVNTAPSINLPFKTYGAIEFKNQAIFNPSKYLYGLARYLNKLPNCRIYENSRVTGRDDNTVQTEFGSIQTKTVVYATHYPIFFDLKQTLVYPYRSYIIAAKVAENIGDDVYWDTHDPYYYTRTYEYEGGRYLVVGGADHKTGSSTFNPFARLESYLHLRYSVDSVDYRWSNQYYEPADGLPYIGKSSNGNEYIATGYSGDGLTNGTIAGYMISQEIMGLKEKQWNGIFDAQRFNLLASAGKFIRENADVAKHYVMDRLNVANTETIQMLAPGDGIVVGEDNQKIAISVDHDGVFHYVKANCSHLNCLVSWNRIEKTWDCPCHGSRFKPDGTVITGPAVENLKKL